MTNDCPHVQIDLKAYADRALPWPRRLIVRRHLAQCDDCRKELTAMTQIADDLRAAEAPDTALDPALRAKLLAAAPASPPLPTLGAGRWPLRLPAVMNFVAVGAAVFLLVAILLPIIHQTVPQRGAEMQTGLGTLQYTQDNDESIQAPLPSHAPAAYPLAFPLDSRSLTILSHADRIDTFRLADFYEQKTYTQAEHNAIYAQPKVIEDYALVRRGRPQTTAFARRLLTALAVAGRPNFLSCFDPGVGFRAWRGRQSVSIFVCFYCSGIRAVTRDAVGREVSERWASLGPARPALLALAREAFPNDARLLALGEHDAPSGLKPQSQTGGR